MRITNVYTRAGDAGTTHLVGGQELSKDDPRVSAYGTLDELNAVVGVTRAWLGTSSLGPTDRSRVDTVLRRVQNDLFRLGGHLATLPQDRWEGQARVHPADIEALERILDTFNADLPPLEEFVLPGGSPVAASLHQARTVCRRAERGLVTLWREGQETDPTPLQYVNRLSDLFFVLSRWTLKAGGQDEVLWER